MRISDWSSDVCSSDLLPAAKIQGETFNAGYQNMSIADIALVVKQVVEEEFPGRPPIDIVTTPTDDIRSYHVNSDKIRNAIGFQPKRTVEDAVRGLCRAFREGRLPNSLTDDRYFRSEEHTSELQSLMRISYAVFCLKKQKHKKYNKNQST